MKCLDKLVNEIIAKYYPNTLSGPNKLSVYLKNERVLSSYLIGLKQEHKSTNDHNAFKEVIKVLDGTIVNYFEFINCYVANFKNDHLDINNLSKLISIKYVESNGIFRLT